MPNPAGSSTVPDLPDSRNARRVAATVCAACGCLCDDIVLVLEDDRIAEIGNTCAVGERWFRAESSPLLDEATPASIEGHPADYSTAVRRSVELLRESRAPIILGLTQTTIETVRIATAIADKIGAVIDTGSSRASLSQAHAFQRQGKVTATLGEVKNRADVILFWGVDPVTTHPRHFERYSVDAPGRFRPGGRADRTLLVVDAGPTPTSRLADWSLPISGEKELDALRAMRALLKGQTPNRDRVRESTGCSIEDLGRLVDRLKGAEYGAIFVDAKYGDSNRSLATLEAMSHFVRDLNQVSRCVMLSLGGPGNRAGVEAVLSWQTGFPNAVDLGPGHPESIPGVTSAIYRLARGEADLALFIADPLPVDFPSAALRHLSSISKIVVSPATVAYDFEPTVRFSPGNPLLTSVGSIIRCDGVPLPVRAPLRCKSPSDRDCLREIASKLDEFDHTLQIRA